MVDIVDHDSYHLEKHATEYIVHPGASREVHVLKKLARTLPDGLEIDAHGWGPFKQLVLRR